MGLYIEGTLATILPLVVVEGDVVTTPVPIEGATTLPLIAVSGVVHNDDPTIEATLATTLPLVSVAGVVPIVENFLDGAVRLPRIRTIGRAQGPPSMQVYGGVARAPAFGGTGASTIVTFRGLPDRVVVWTLVSGAATLTPLSALTDANGYASCQVEPTGEGTAEIQVEYVP